MNVHTYTPMDAVSYADRQTDAVSLPCLTLIWWGRGKESKLSSFIFAAGWEALTVGVSQGKSS